MDYEARMQISSLEKPPLGMSIFPCRKSSDLRFYIHIVCVATSLMFTKQQSSLLKWSQGREVASAQLIVLTFHVIIKRLTFELVC